MEIRWFCQDRYFLWGLNEKIMCKIFPWVFKHSIMVISTHIWCHQASDWLRVEQYCNYCTAIAQSYCFIVIQKMLMKNIPWTSMGYYSLWQTTYHMVSVHSIYTYCIQVYINYYLELRKRYRMFLINGLKNQTSCLLKWRHNFTKKFRLTNVFHLNRFWSLYQSQSL